MLQTFLKYLEFEKKYSQHTLISYQTDISQFEAYSLSTNPDFTLEKSEHRHIRAWIVDLIENGTSPRSVNRKLSSLKSLFKFSLGRAIISENPTLKVRNLKVAKKLPAFVPANQMKDLLEGFDFEDCFEDSRDALILALLYGTGIRLSELLNVKPKHIDLHKKTIRVLGKGNKERIIPLYDKLIERINNYLHHKDYHFGSNEQQVLFVTNKGADAYPMMINRIVKKYLSVFSTVEKTSPHVMRHSFATHLLDQGADLNAVKDLLGHSSLAATQVYTHNSLDKLKKVFDQAHPKA